MSTRPTIVRGLETACSRPVRPDPGPAHQVAASARRLKGAYQRPSSFRMTTMTTTAPIKVMMPIACLRPGFPLQMTGQCHPYQT